MRQDVIEQLSIAKSGIGVVVFGILLLSESFCAQFNLFTRLSERARHGALNLLVAALHLFLTWGVFLPIWTLAANGSQRHDFGILYWLQLPFVSRLIMAVVCLDFVSYLWHLMNHRAPGLWRFHRVHHSDLAMDVTTANRFHVGEIFLSGWLRLVVIVVLGLQLHEILVFEIGLAIVVQFHHANIGLPDWLDERLRWVIPTPHMHKLHHSRVREETNSNYGSIFSVWDRFFGTLQVSQDLKELSFGLDEFRNPEQQGFFYLLSMPLLSSSKIRKMRLLTTPEESAALAENYAKYRPSYPPKIALYLKKICGLQPEHVVADIGSGVGISSKLFLKFGCNVLSVEPDDAMRAAAREYLAEFEKSTRIDGTAEETTLATDSADFIVAAQSFQAFKIDAAKREFTRVLRPGGWCVLMWNQRPMKEAFAKEYELILRDLLPGYNSKEVRPLEEMIEGFFETDQHYESFRNYQPLTYEGLLGRARSFPGGASRPLDIQNELSQRLRRLYEKYNERGHITFEYVTHVYVGKFRSEAPNNP